MQHADIEIHLNTHQPTPNYYKVADLSIATNVVLNLLSAFKSTHPYLASKHSRQPFHSDFKPHYSNESWLAGRNRKISCNHSAEGYQIIIPEVAHFFVQHNGGYIQQLTQNTSPNSKHHYATQDHIEQTLLGPPLTLALALKQHFMLHASAVMINGQAILFTGNSGQGKSTLAGWLNKSDRVERLADDLCVLQIKQNQLILLPAFVQLKLTKKQQQNTANSINIKAIIQLNRGENQKLHLNKLHTLNAAQILLNNSVSVQLFDQDLAKKHLEFIAQAQQETSIYKLSYPNGQQHSRAIEQILKKLVD